MKKLLPFAGVTLALALALTGCTNADEPAATKSPTATKSATATPTPSATPSAEPTATATATEKPEDAKAEVEVTWQALGEKKENDEYVKFPVKLAVTVPSIEKLSDEELEEVNAVADDEQKNTFAAFDFYKVNVEQTYVSGKDPVNQSSYTDFDVVDAKGVELNDLPLIGFDWCATNSFSEDFVKGTPNKSCLVGAVAKGAEAPAGVQFSQSDTKYDAADGKPETILKK
jgi:hypothetical protein